MQVRRRFKLFLNVALRFLKESCIERMVHSRELLSTWAASDEGSCSCCFLVVQNFRSTFSNTLPENVQDWHYMVRRQVMSNYE